MKIISFKKTIEDIKSLKIQGAEDVAKAGLNLIEYTASRSKVKKPKQLIDELNKVKIILFKTRPTEPALRNAISSVLYRLGGSNIIDIKKQLKLRVHRAISHFSLSKNIIADIGSKLIKDDYVIFTHCHSSTVISILKKAKEKGINFEVHNTETRPLFQGRKTAKELLELKIPVTLYVDSAARIAIKNADLAFFGADAITSTGKVINKVGSELFAESLERFQVPLYIAANSWKFDPKTAFGFEEIIEKRFSSEVWKNPPKALKIQNYAFEKISPELVEAIISELGIYNFSTFIQELKTKYNFLFEN